MYCFVIVRYSVVSWPSATTWRIGRGARERYQSIALHPERLEGRDFLFRNVCLPSFVNQSRPPGADWFQLIVITSSLLPGAFFERLKKALDPYPWAVIATRDPQEEVDPGREVQQLAARMATTRGSPLCYATVRIDDDDGLSRDYMARLERHVRPELAGYGVNFPAGHSLLVSVARRRAVRCIPNFLRLPSAGIGLIDVMDPGEKRSRSGYSSIYAAGRHSRIDRVIPVINDLSKPTFLKTIHRGRDRYEKANIIRKFMSGRSIPWAEVRRDFVLGDELELADRPTIRDYWTV